MIQSMQRANIPNAMTHRDQRSLSGRGLSPSATPILIVDSDRSASVALSFMLAAAGYDDVRAVRSAARAVILAEKYRPSIVFLEIDLADGGGFDLANQLKRGAQQRSLRLIALTSNSEHPSREKARTAGFERFLVKPATQAELDLCLGKLPG
jgi:two-component system CheB/CheR fusion protein